MVAKAAPNWLIAMILMILKFKEWFFLITKSAWSCAAKPTMLRSIATSNILQADRTFIIEHTNQIFSIEIWGSHIVLNRWLVQRRLRILTWLDVDIDEWSIVGLSVQLRWP